MDRSEINKELQLTYDELCRYLQDKYGLPKGNYYAKEDSKSKNRAITRTSEGLFCHHVYESIYDNIGEPHLKNHYPYECQKSENLAYCNYIEHLILHLKINVMARSSFDNPQQIRRFFNSLGFFWIGADINFLYKNGESQQEWKNNCFSIIKDNFEDYVSILKSVIQFIDDNYHGEKESILKAGTEIPFEVIDFSYEPDMTQVRGSQYHYKTVTKKIKKVSRLKKYVIFEGDERKYKIDGIKAASNYDGIMDENIRTMASVEQSAWDELYSLLTKPSSKEEKEIAKWLKDSSTISELRLKESTIESV